MKLQHVLVLIFLSCCPAAGLQAQERFTSCTAIFFNEKMLVDDYSPTGVCRIATSARGTLSVHTVDLGPAGARAVDRLKFRVALRDGQTRTLLSLSDKTYRALDLGDVLEKCRPGDSIVILTVDDHYALPHAEVLVE